VLPSITIYQRKVDVIIILAWPYADQIISSNYKFLQNGGCFAVPLPKILELLILIAHTEYNIMSS